jgi:hypothetical protein
MKFRDLFEGKERDEFDEWAHHQREVTLKGMADSAVVLSIYEREFSIDYALQVGAMILMDKPILVMTAPGMEIPPKLRQVADEIIEVHPDALDNSLHPDRARIGQQVRAFMEKHAP